MSFQQRHTEAAEAALEQKRNEWLSVLSGADRNAICSQLSRMSWDIASFRSIVELRRLVPRDCDGSAKLNLLLHDLLDEGFFERQMLAIRRLVDSYPLSGDKGSLCLTAVLDDMIKHRHLLTRQLMCGLLRRKLPPHAAPMLIQVIDERIDALAGIDPSRRANSDTISETVLQNLKRRITDAAADVKTYVDKFIAHAATPGSRAVKRADDIRITLDHVGAAHRAMCEVTGFVLIRVLADSCASFLPVPQYDQFAYLDLPLADSDGLMRIKQVWRQVDDECRAASQWGVREYETEYLSGPPLHAQGP